MARTLVSASIASILVIICSVGSVNAQYFGQNKVIYQNFDFQILKTDHFDIYFYTREEPAIRDAARMAERWYARYSKFLGFELQGRQPLIMYASSPQFGQTNVVGGQLGEGTGGVTESSKRRIVLPFAGPYKETDHVIGHELAHAFQYSLSGIQQGRPARQNSPAAKLPLWFIEGMAEYLSLGPRDPHTAMWMRDAVVSKDKLPDIGDLENPRYFPYRWGQALLAYIGGRWGDSTVSTLFKVGMKSGDIKASIRSVLAIGPDTLSMDWHEALHAAYDSVKTITSPAESFGREVIGAKHGGGDLNIGPVISPDGSQLMFFSEKSLFAVNLYLANVETGKITKTIVRTELDPHFSSLEFINSAGAWSPDGKRIIFTSVVKNTPQLSILDVSRGKVVQEIKLSQLDEAFNPSWSPDGNRIVFSGQAGGYSDLYLYDLQAGSLMRLTNDPYADIQPAWSPDGQSIAFVTDRYDSDLDSLAMGNYQLAIFRPDTMEITSLRTFDKGKSINPQWSSDGKDLYFVSDQNGISNIYRLNLDDNSTHQVTNVYTGVSGITSISPSISVAVRSNRLAYCTFEDGKYNIYMINSPSSLTDVPGRGEADLAMLPPSDRSVSQVLDFQNNASEGLPPQANFPVEPYHTKLSIDYVGQPTIAAGYDALGVQLGGGVAFLFSDMLGDHTLATALQLQTDGGFTDVGALLGYQNTHHRWNWGGAVQQVPYTTTAYANGLALSGADTVYVEQQLSYRQMNREISAMAAYPFDRTKRVEFQVGLARIDFEQKITTQIYDPISGNLISNQQESLPALDPINVGTASSAFVFDNAIYGATSPLLGQRFRIEAQPTFGSLRFSALTADFRRYFMPIRPFTLAVRALHFGRYGKDSEDTRLTPLFLGYQELVRGYNASSFDASECQGDTNCPQYNRLFGSKVAIANVELRFPLLGLLGAGSGYYGFFPIETGVFYDIGFAWSQDQKPSFLNGGTRKPVKSYGALMRANILGYLVVEVDYVKPVDRPEKGTYWQFNISPGF